VMPAVRWNLTMTMTLEMSPEELLSVAVADLDDRVAVADTAVDCTGLWKSNSCACFSFLFGCMLLTCSEIITEIKNVR